VHLSSAGIYQTKNVRTVLTAVEQLRASGRHISDEAVVEGLEKANQLTGLRGRWEIIGKEPTIIMDVAHNEDGIQRVVDQLTTQYRNSKIRFIIGFVKDKDIRSILNLLPSSANYYFTNAHLPRALPHKELKERAAAAGLKGESYDDINDALAAAVKASRPEDVIMICGSFFIFQDLRPLPTHTLSQ
jgi:dihydrofolate synthase/folylpolyglutamate synthase